MLFSPSIMADLPSDVIPTDHGALSFYHWQGTYSAWQDFMRACMRDDSPGGNVFRNATSGEGAHNHFGQWSGVEQSPASVLQQGFYTSAFSEFQRAQAKLETDRFQPGALRAMPAGGAWVIPLVLGSNPLPSRIRERTKLPPRNLELVVNVSAGIRWQDITASMARIARASWDYIEAGGAVTITVHYVHKFGRVQGGNHGVLVSIKVPITNQAAFASACSTQEYRGFSMTFASLGLSPIQGDGLPLVKYTKPGVLHVTGRVQDDAKARAALKIADAPVR